MNRVVSGRARMGLSRPILAGFLAMCIWSAGCASKQDVSALQRQIWAVRRDLDKNKEHVAQLDQRLQEELEGLSDKLEADRQPLRRSQAAVGAQLDRIELELGSLSGQLEEAAVMNTRNGERISALQEDQMTTMLKMQKTVDDLQRRLNLMANSLGLQELAAASKPQRQEEKRTVGGKKTATGVKTTVQQTNQGAEEHYGKAFELYRAKQFQPARDEFASFLERYPKTDLADNAQFWIGECYYSEEKYRQAIAAYEKTIKQYPQSDKVSSALLKQGLAFLELGDKTAGKILLKKVVNSYPNSNQAKIAQNKLARTK